MEPSSPTKAASETFTFPDGHVSFEYPVGWRVELFTGEQKPATSGTATVFDASGTAQAYRMHLTAGAPLPGEGSALDGIIRLDSGVLVADVKFIEKPFPSDEAAKTWLAGAEGQALEAGPI